MNRAHVAAQLAQRPTNDPPIAAETARSLTPTFHEVARDIGWPAFAARINRWVAAGKRGDFTDAAYDPSPRPGGNA